MTKLNKRRSRQAYKILPIIKAVETAILITITIYKAIKWANRRNPDTRSVVINQRSEGGGPVALKMSASATWYSPQLSGEIVSRLYHRAKIEGVPMTVLANRIMEKALDTERVIVGRPNAQQNALNQQRSRHAETGSDTRA
jgi:hypothetical protein